jgi:hypothetical protein
MSAIRTATRSPSATELGQLTARGSNLRLDSDAARIICPAQHDLEAVFGDVLVDGFARPLPVPVVIDDEHAAARESWIEVDQFVLRR